MLAVAAVLAHQGGWDEFLLVAAPIALLGGLLWLANRRATAQQRHQEDADADESAPTPPS